MIDERRVATKLRNFLRLPATVADEEILERTEGTFLRKQAEISAAKEDLCQSIRQIKFTEEEEGNGKGQRRA